MANAQSTAKYEGAIALTTMLVVMAVLTASGIALVLTSINLRNSTRAYYNAKVAAAYVTNCLEESVDRLKIDKSYTGTMEITLDGGDCTVVVSNAAQQDIKVIDVTSTADQYEVDRQFRLDTSDYPYTLE
ncbi:MAG: hypothetical protein QY318_03230 [Candidatus Dojkabacteria bacterium]|nr:MAG: hypothetical protein QY318_03230 [Candidatus Dojkabacteria bacterium]